MIDTKLKTVETSGEGPASGLTVQGDLALPVQFESLHLVILILNFKNILSHNEGLESAPDLGKRSLRRYYVLANIASILCFYKAGIFTCYLSN